MLWRESYSTRVLESPRIPALIGSNLNGDSWDSNARIALAANFSLREMQQRDVWLRLFQAELEIPRALGVVLSEWSEKDLEQLRSATPRSRWPEVFAFTDSECAWKNLIEPDSPARVFALLVEQGQTNFVMIGPPTEEAWERFLTASRQPLQSSQ